MRQLQHLANNSVWIKQKTEIRSGDVIVNNSSTGLVLNDGVELSIGQSVTTPAGYTVRANRIAIRQKAVVNGDVYFNDVLVPDSARLGALGNGIPVALSVLERMRTSVAAAANGFAKRAFDESRRRLLARQQFGKPLAAMQSLAFDIAEMDTRLRAAELLTDEAAEVADQGGDATLEVARAKLFATENAGWICDRAVQHFGGLGVKRGSVVEALYRDVRALRIYEGSSEVQKLILAKELFRRSR